MGLTTYDNYNMEDIAEFTVYVPKIFLNAVFLPITT